jgi:acetyltransferase-like isoleucine patch superfamily enzyme
MAISAASVHETAEVAASAEIGEGTRLWAGVQVREGARIGRECVLGKGVYIDVEVSVGDRAKLENYVSIFRGGSIGSGAFIGPHTCLLNDRFPRATRADGSLKGADDWTCTGVAVAEGASVGGGCTVLPGVTIGAYALIGAGTVVVRDIPAHALAVGNPARVIGYVCRCGHRLSTTIACSECGNRLDDVARD